MRERERDRERQRERERERESRDLLFSLGWLYNFNVLYSKIKSRRKIKSFKSVK